MMKQSSTTNGFAMLFTVLVMSLILTIAVGISNTTFKQTILSSLAKDSQAAFYQADSAMECALYYDITKGYFPKDVPFDQVPLTLPCGTQTMTFDVANSTPNYLFYTQVVTDPTKGCYGMLFNKTSALFSAVQAKGYSVCQDTPRKVERVLEVRYTESEVDTTGVVVPPGGTGDDTGPGSGDLIPADEDGGDTRGGEIIRDIGGGSGDEDVLQASDFEG